MAFNTQDSSGEPKRIGITGAEPLYPKNEEQKPWDLNALRVLANYIETGLLPANVTLYEDFSHALVSRNMHAVTEAGKLYVFNGGRFLQRDTGDTEQWTSQPVSDQDFKPENFYESSDQVRYGTTIYTANGERIHLEDDEPLGAFTPDSLREKIASTQRAEQIAQEHNIPVALPHYIAALTFTVEGTSREFAAGIYTYQGITMPYLEAIDPIVSPPEVSALIRYGMYSALGAFARAGYIHPQPNAGNRVVCTYLNELFPGIGDWENLQDVRSFDNIEATHDIGWFEQKTFLVTARELAEIHTLYQALDTDISTELFEPTRNLSYDDMLKECIMPMVRGYLGVDQFEGFDEDNFLRGCTIDIPYMHRGRWQNSRRTLESVLAELYKKKEEMLAFLEISEGLPKKQVAAQKSEYASYLEAYTGDITAILALAIIKHKRDNA